MGARGDLHTRYRQIINLTIKKEMNYLFSTLAILSFISLHAQHDNLWDLKRCIDHALNNNIQVGQSELNAQSARVSLEQSKAELLPTLNTGTGVSYNIGRSVNPFTNIIEDQDISSQNYFLSSSVDLFAGFRKQNAIKMSRANLEASVSDYEDTKNRVALEITASFLQIVFNQEIIKNNKYLVEITQVQVDQARKMVAAGSMAINTLLDLEAQLANNEFILINSENNLELSILRLKQQLLIPSVDEFHIAIPELEDPIDASYELSINEVIDIAYGSQPMVKAAKSRVVSNEYALAMARAGRMPTLTLSGQLFSSYSSVAPNIIPRAGSPLEEIFVPIGFVGGDPNSPVFSPNPQRVPVEFVQNTYMNQLETNFRRGISLNLNIPLFNGWSVRSNIANSSIQRQNAQLQEVNVKNQLRQEIEQAYLDMNLASKRFYASKRRMEAQEEAFRVAKRRLEVGAMNAVDFTVAQNNLNQAQTEFAQAKFDYIFKTKILDFYSGKPIDL
jgi:outer membrane protein